MDTEHIAITEPVRRLEVFTGPGRRRKWSGKDKARIVAEIVASGDSVCAVARRHGLSPQQLFGWRRQAPRCESEPDVGTIEVEVDGVTIRVGRGADATTIAAIVQARKASR